ncbi:MAG: RNA-binding transcriptional accessory protein [Lachnospiraceae bacterium]|nr:RNA-binding transcriptional accessory protein [Lachnospiraceae bacterium]MDD7027353.1 Tex family protein [Lachnospiraceae bacterium]MDY5700040.1 Tex family protein [Lachnospiraceae bacterium]
MDILQKLTEELEVQKWQIEAAVGLIDEGNTIPFISRYRKEATGSLNDEQLRSLHERLVYLRNLEEKKQQVLSSIEEQGKLTEELKEKILQAQTQVQVEDLYRPYRPKRKTRASMAKEKGLEPLARIIVEQEIRTDILKEAEKYISEEKEVKTAEEALQGAKDILAEAISDEADYRTYIRNITMEEGRLITAAKDEKVQSVYEMYYSYEEPLKQVAGHRTLAINRGEKEKFLTVKVEAPVERILTYLEKKTLKKNGEEDNPVTTPILQEVVSDAYQRLIAPAIEREIRNELTEKAEDGAISVFGRNLEQLLLQPPIAGKVVLGWDPAFRTGCKLAVVDETGKVLDTRVIYPTAPQNRVEEAKAELKKLIKKYGISLISVGNGTASRESEQIIVELLKELDTPVQYVIVNEAGASVYSASKLATEEFPEFDVGQRSAASIARRLQDPLAELVKIDPKSIGVGQYQHDMNQKKLSEALTGVVEDSVNKVGVDLNTASASLMEYISGISKTLAKNIVDYRETNGRFTDRRQLLKVPKLGPKAFEQCAGFMRILDGTNPLDATSVHPESYEATMRLLEKLNLTMEDVKEIQKQAAKKPVKKEQSKKPVKKQVVIRNTNTAMGKALAAAMAKTTMEMGDKQEESKGQQNMTGLEKRVKDKKKMAQELGIGELTLTDILKELEKPARDPREDMPRPILRSDILEMKDLKPGMILKGTVRNVIDFGAFVDIGVHQDGLVHISQITDKFIKHPLEAVSVGDVVDVQVLTVDTAKKRIGLTMKLDRKNAQ